MQDANENGQTMVQATAGFQAQTAASTKLKGALINLGNIGGKALTMLGNALISMGISMAISAAIQGIQNLAHSYENLMKKVNEYNKEYQEANKQLTDYSTEISSLRETMESSSSTTQEVADATSRLYEIQNDLISTYGSYASGIDLVNGSLETQLDLIDRIDKANLQNTVDKIQNERSAKASGINLLSNLYIGGLTGLGVGVNVPKYISDVISGQKTGKDIGDVLFGESVFGKDFGSDAVDNAKDIEKTVRDFKKTIKGIKVDDQTAAFLQGLETFSYENGTISISGDVNQVKKDIDTLRDLMTEAEIPIGDKLNKKLTEAAGDVGDIIEESGEAYNTLMLNSIVNGDDTLIENGQQKAVQEYYEKLLTLYQDYADAKAKGDSDLVKETEVAYVKGFNEIKSSLEASGIDQAYVDYFENMYPDLQNAINDWDIKQDLDEVFDWEWDLSKYIKNNSFEDIKSDYFRVINAEENSISDEEINRFTKLGELAAAHNTDVIRLIQSYKSLEETVKTTTSAIDSLNVNVPSFELITTALNEQKETGTLTKETIESLNKTYGDLSEDLYTFTENGVLVNTEAMRENTEQMAKAAMVKAQIKEAKAVKEYQREAKTLKELVGEHGALAVKYAKGKDALKSYINSTDTLSDSLKTDLNLSLQRLDTLSEEISKYDMLEAQIRATTSTLNEYVEATSTANEKDNFDTATSMVSSLKDAFEKGWTGTDEFKEGMEYLAGYDFDSNIFDYGDPEHNTDWVTEVEKYLTRAERYFTEDISGIYNFLDDAVEKTHEDTQNFIDKSAEGIYTIDIDNIDEFAKKMDMSVSSVMDLLLATDEAWDFDIDFSSIEDGIIDGLKEIPEDSAEARTSLKEVEKTIDELEEAGYDPSKIKEMRDAFKEASVEISPDLAIDEKISSYSKDAIDRWAESIVNEADGVISGTEIDFDADIGGLTTTIDKLKEIRNNAKITGEFDETEYTHASVVLESLIDRKHELESKAIMDIDVSQLDATDQDLANAVSLVQTYVSAYQELDKAQTLNLDSDAIDEASEKVENLQYQLANTDMGALSKIGIDTSTISVEADPSQLYETLTKVDVNDNVKNSTVDIKADDSKAQSVLSGFVEDINNATGTVDINGTLAPDFYDVLESKIKNSGTYTVDVQANVTGGTTPSSSSSGKAEAEGGTIRASSTNNLVGELGQEMVVSNGKYYTVGDKGAEIVPLKKGDIVFNAQQTAELLRNGQIGSRGKLIGSSFVSGTLGNAYASGKGAGTGNTAGSDTWKKRKASSTSSSSSGSSSSSSDSTDDTEDETEETFDWVEVAIQRIEEELTRLEEIADSVYETWATRNEWVRKEIDKTTEEIELQTRAAQIYLDKANSIGLEAEYAEKIQNGEAIDINSIETIYNDDDLVDRIQDYQTWYEKYIEAYDQIQTLGIQLQEYYKELFDNIQSEYDDLITNIEKKTNIIDERISRTEEHGYFVDQEYYDALLALESKNEAELVAEREKLINSLNEAVRVGNIKNGSEAWNDMYQQIEDVNKALEESATNVVKLNNEIRQLQWDKFDWLEDRVSDISEEADFLIKLLQGELNIDDNGNFNNRGFAQAALIGAKYDDTLKEAQRYQKEIQKINATLAKDPNDKELIARKEELVKGYRSAIEAAEDEKQAMKSLVEEAINKHLEALQELIDKYKESLETSKDLYDWQKNVADQTKNIANLQKQLAAYQGDTSEEARKKRQELQNQLNSAEQQLEESQWDRYISETGTMLDNLYTDYEDYLNGKLDEVKVLMDSMIGYVNDNTNAVKGGMDEIKREYGLTTENFENFGNTSGNILSIFQNGDFSGKLSQINSNIDIFRDKMVEVTNTASNGVKEAIEKKSFDIEIAPDGTVVLRASNNNIEGKKAEANAKKGGGGGDITEGIQSNGQYQYADGSIAKNEWKQIGSDWYYWDSEGNMAKNQYAKWGDNEYYWLGETGKWDGGTAASWRQDSNGWWLGNQAGWWASSEWIKVGDDWYYFNPSGYMASGEYQGGYWLNSDGSWDKGATATWKSDSTGWWYEDSNGWYPKNQWEKIDGTWYYFDENGYMVTGTRSIGGKSYSFNSSGAWKGYYKGSEHIPKDQFALTQEKGSELIYKTNSGALLTPLNQGDMVFTNEMSQRLWDIAKGNIPIGANLTLPNVGAANTRNITTNNDITIELPNVQNYEDFKREMKQDRDLEKFWQEITIGQVMGNNKLNKNKY